MVAVDSIDDYENFIKPLSDIGYQFRRDNRDTQEHILFVKGSEDFRTHYLKLTQKNTKFWKEHILFRDYLIKHPKVAKEYQELKEKLQSSYSTDRANYTEAKADFIQDVLKMAKKE